MSVSIKVGFVPSYRFAWTFWTQKMRDESLAAIESLPGVEVVVPGVGPEGSQPNPETGAVALGGVHNLDEAEAVAEYFARQHVDALILCPLDFGDERSAAKIAEKLDVPVLLYATKEPPALEGPAMARASDSYCGNLSMASALYRRKIPFHYAGIFFPDEPEFLAEIDKFVRAAAVVKGLRGARLGQVGVRPPTFETVGYDEVALIQKFGQNMVYANISDVTGRADALNDDDPRVQEVIANVRGSVAEITVSDHYLVNAAKLEVALSDFARTNKLSAMAVQCWPSVQQLTGISVCAVYGRLTDNVVPTACETDVLGAVAMLATYHAAMGEYPPHFVDWTIQHRENPNWLLAWHCGNAPVSLARTKEEVALRSRKDMAGALPTPDEDAQAGLYQFRVRPGKVTFCRLAEYDNAWKMLIARGDAVPSDETLAGTWSWVEVSDHAKLYRTLVEEGFIHHASMIHGDLVEPLVLACKFLDIEPVIVN